MHTHDCINGRSIEYDATPAEAKFLRRIEAAVEDEKVSEAEVRSWIYGPENPMLAQQQSGYTFVTADVFENPVFRVLLDLLDRKRLAAGSLDLERAAARFTMTVAQAAEQLGLGESAIRMAVRAGRLPAWMKGGDIRLDPTAVAAYKGGTRRGGPATKLVVAVGSHDGTSLRLRVDGKSAELDAEHKDGGIVHGEISKWTHAEVITGAKRAGKTTYRYWKIEPGGHQERIAIGELKVVGRFTIVDQRNGEAASEAWHAGKAKPKLYRVKGRPDVVVGANELGQLSEFRVLAGGWQQRSAYKGSEDDLVEVPRSTANETHWPHAPKPFPGA